MTVVVMSTIDVDVMTFVIVVSAVALLEVVGSRKERGGSSTQAV